MKFWGLRLVYLTRFSAQIGSSRHSPHTIWTFSSFSKNFQSFHFFPKQFEHFRHLSKFFKSSHHFFPTQFESSRHFPYTIWTFSSFSNNFQLFGTFFLHSANPFKILSLFKPTEIPKNLQVSKTYILNYSNHIKPALKSRFSTFFATYPPSFLFPKRSLKQENTFLLEMNNLGEPAQGLTFLVLLRLG